MQRRRPHLNLLTFLLFRGERKSHQWALSKERERYSLSLSLSLSLAEIVSGQQTRGWKEGRKKTPLLWKQKKVRRQQQQQQQVALLLVTGLPPPSKTRDLVDSESDEKSLILDPAGSSNCGNPILSKVERSNFHLSSRSGLGQSRNSPLRANCSFSLQ